MASRSKADAAADHADQVDAPDSVATVEESRWRAGVNRQARPDAHEHQAAAARALGEKRKANAMPKEERDARRNEAKRAKRAEAKEREAAAAKEAAEREAAVTEVVDGLLDDVVQQWMEEEHPTLDELNEWLDEDGEDAVCEAEFDDFILWLHDEYLQHGELEPEDYEPDAFVELFEEWRCSSEYEQRALDYEVDQWDGWDGESVVSDHETEPAEMYCCDDAGEPDDPDDPYGGPDLGYEGVDEMRDQWDREFGSPWHVHATVRPRRGQVKLSLTVAREYGQGRDWDDHVDAVYAEMEAAAYPFLSSPTQYPTVKELPPPPRRVDYDLGEAGRTAYHEARAVWYRKRTRQILTGTLAEQEELFDNACRYQRARRDRETAGSA